MRSSLMLFFCVISIALSAQRSLEKANKQYELNAYNLAVNAYLDVLAQYPDHAEAMSKLADSYRLLNKMTEAEYHYTELLVRRSYAVDPIHYLNYGHVLKTKGRYTEAKKWYERYAAYDAVMGKQFAKSCDFALSQINVVGNYSVGNEMINSLSSDFSPAFFREDVVFASARTEGQPTRDWSGVNKNQLYKADRGLSGYLQTANPLFTYPQQVFNKAPITFSPNGRWVAYCANNFVDGTRQLSETGAQLSLYTAELTASGGWVNEKPFPYNGENFSTGYPTFSPDGNALYFASDRPDGFGGYDLYVSYRSNGTWSQPENLGSIVNSPGDEITPYFDGVNLFFSSDWQQGFGGFDIFRAEKSNDNWTKIYHLGAEVNTGYDDYGFIFDANKSLGYLTSNRPGGRGAEDIYKVTRQSSTASIEVSSATTGYPLTDVLIDLSDCGLGTFKADANGRFTLPSTDRIDCNMVIRKEGYISTILKLNSINRNTARAYVIKLQQQNEQYIGSIIDAQSRMPVQGVRVIATNQTNSLITEAYTDASGTYSLGLASDAVYLIRYSKAGYADVNRNVQTLDGKDKTILGILPFQSSTTIGGSSTTTTTTTTTTTSPVVTTTTPPTTTTTTTTTATNGYAVQVAATRKLDMNSFANLKHLGNIYYQKVGDIYKIRVGVYTGRSSAEDILSQVKKLGYPTAFITSESIGAIGNNQIVVNGNTTTTTTTIPSSTTLGVSGYKIRLGAFLNVQNFDDSTVRNYGMVEQYRKQQWTIMLLGTYRNLSEARAVLANVRRAGYIDAYIVTDVSGELIKVE